MAHKVQPYAVKKAKALLRAGQPCSRCKQNSRPANGSWCNSCCAQYARDRESATGSGWKAWLRRKYEITSGEYQTLLAQQGGVCGICGVPPKRRRLNTDHSHRSGIIRGLLCPRCNRGLPWFRDNPALLESAARYLRSSLS